MSSVTARLFGCSRYRHYSGRGSSSRWEITRCSRHRLHASNIIVNRNGTSSAVQARRKAKIPAKVGVAVVLSRRSGVHAEGQALHRRIFVGAQCPCRICLVFASPPSLLGRDSSKLSAGFSLQYAGRRDRAGRVDHGLVPLSWPCHQKPSCPYCAPVHWHVLKQQPSSGPDRLIIRVLIGFLAQVSYRKAYTPGWRLVFRGRDRGIGRGIGIVDNSTLNGEAKAQLSRRLVEMAVRPESGKFDSPYQRRG